MGSKQLERCDGSIKIGRESKYFIHHINKRNDARAISRQASVTYIVRRS